MKKILFYGIILFVIVSCNNKIENVERGFYYWKSGQSYLNNDLDSILEKTKTEKLYVKFFEIENNELMGNIPIAKNRMRFYNKKIEVIPTVFLQNEVFLKSNIKEIDLLADNVNFLINKFINNEFDKEILVKEFQMDCDWTIKSKENFFYFLKKIKQLSKKEISCTLRLYPYKYPNKMGIPPVDKVTLMCYNLLNPLENPKQNSILDIDELKKYLNGAKKYPLHTDIALPIYSWMQLYQNNQFQNVIYEDHSYLIEKMRKIEPFWYEVTEDVSVGENYIRIGDKIKYEEVKVETIKTAIDLLKKNIDFDSNTTITLFHLDNSQLQKYTDEEISSLYTAFSK
jgi:hypothetical protein